MGIWPGVFESGAETAGEKSSAAVRSDSYEYDMVGGTRKSERKKAKRKDKPVE
jgi:hypothetical protein